ncbi:hypothetical protein HAZT_HAZT000645 [Hyalella azteca]|uniref:C2H2-type domain-containing protein n=1 Tax=Hyalella azteca TaxID=294128 RepID=A0A6A0HB25_HYAAZ|nr:hypothetical protein HAZT_HAZT000645 [Hyalella azteca]
MEVSLAPVVLQSVGVRCPWCIKVFYGRNKKQDCKRHLLSHTGERPFSCPHCPYRAALKGNLKKHLFTHERTHGCNVWPSLPSAVNPALFAAVAAVSAPFTEGLSQLNLGGHQSSSSLSTQYVSSVDRGALHTQVCPICNKVFDRENPSWSKKYNRHMIAHSGSKPFKCYFCDYRSSRKDSAPVSRSLEELMLWLDDERRCRVCGKQFLPVTPWKQRLDRHINTHSGARPFACPCCSHQCARKDALKLHMTRRHGVVLLAKKYTSETATSTTAVPSAAVSLSQEVVTIAKNLSSRTQGDRSSSDSYTSGCSDGKLEDRNSDATLESPNEKGSKPSSGFLLEDFWPTSLFETASNAPVERRTCPYCRKVFTMATWKQKLERHMLIHTGADVTSTPPDGICVIQRATSSHLKTTVSRSRSVYRVRSFDISDTPLRPRPDLAAFDCTDGALPLQSYPPLSGDLGPGLECDKCPRVFYGSSRKYRLDRHLLTHSGEKPFHCSMCPYRATQQGNLNRHIKSVHCGDEVGFVYGSSGSLEMLGGRMDSANEGDGTGYPDHHGLPADQHSQCHVCLKVFYGNKRKYRLDRHMAEEVDACGQCGKEFTGKNRRNNLVRHVRTHSGEKPFACPACPYRATRKEHMIRHLKKGSCVYHKFKQASNFIGLSVSPYDDRVKAAVEAYLQQFAPKTQRKFGSDSSNTMPYI